MFRTLPSLELDYSILHAEHVSKLVFKQCLELRTSKSTGIINIELEVSHKREVMTRTTPQRRREQPERTSLPSYQYGKE